MNEILAFVVRHGPSVLFAAVFVEQLGIPLPAAPWLLAGGALAVTGEIHWLPSLTAAILGSLVADAIWFNLGRYRGHRVLNLLCRISLEPDTCVRRTEDLFTHYGMRGVIVAKFVPGLSTLAPPLAGISGVLASRFFFFDGIASLLYAGGLILTGAIFSRQLEQVIAALGSLGSGALAVVGGLIAAYIGYKYFQRRRLLKALRTARITVDELYQKLQAGETPVILDLRSTAEMKRNPSLIRGALHMTMDEVQRRQKEIPRDRDIVLYCSCPNEATSARLALSLQRSGILGARPLLGGIDAWKERNYPMEIGSVSVATLPLSGLANPTGAQPSIGT